MLNIYITNLGKYNEGELIGEWVSLPCDDLEAVYNRIGINDHYEEMFITDFESDVPGLTVGEYDNIEALNEEAESFEQFNDSDMAKIGAILEVEGCSLAEAMNIIDDYIFYENMSLLDVAYYEVEELFFPDLPEIAQRYFDYEAYARDLSFDSYYETENGVLVAC